jgi:O-antigen ligase
MNSPQDRAGSPLWLWLITLQVVGGAFYITDHDANMSTLDGFVYSADHLSALTQGGNTARQIAYLSLGGWGVVLLWLSRHKPLQVDGILFPLTLGFVVWICVSVCWSIDRSICIRRIFVFLCCVLGGAGLVRSLRPREIVQLACCIATVYLLIGIGTELSKGTFRPWAGGYRFAGTMHPNAQGANLAVMCLSAFVLSRELPRWKWMYLAILGLGLLMLVLTRSRTATAGTMLGLVIIWGLRASLPRMCVQFIFAVTAVSLLALLAAGLGGHQTGKKLEETILMGRAQDAGSLTGRVPLWNELLRYVVKRPVLGHGYDSFWTEPHIRAVSASQDWAIHEAHSSYLEVLLDLGAIGLMLILVPVVIATPISMLHYLQSGRPEYGFIAGLFVFGIIDGLTESGMTMPNFVPFAAATSLIFMSLGTASGKVPVPRAVPQTSRQLQPLLHWQPAAAAGRWTHA